MKRRALLISAASLLAAWPAAAEEPVLAAIDDLAPGEVQVRGFYLDRPGTVRIEAVGVDRRWHHGELGGAWILDAASRRTVWELRDGRSRRRNRDRDLRDYDDQLDLEAGVYEVYYATFPEWGWHPDDDDESWWKSVVHDFIGWDDDFGDLAGDLGITVRGPGRRASEGDLERARRGITDAALVSLTGVADGTLASRGFRLDRPLDVEVYAVGEVPESGGADYGWIVDTATREKVWTLTYGGSEPAGGAKKNRADRERLHLPAGSYAAVFVADTTHSPRRWNAPPPHDPAFWGLTVTVAKPEERRYASTFDFSYRPQGEVIAAVVKVRDDRFEHAGFTLAKPLDVRVYALGEGSDGDLYDYGWIADARTRRKVWGMDYHRTEHAGGSEKNRLADETLRLEAGSYLIDYVTDGSHAWGDWNAEPPYDPDRWGITLFAAGPGFDRSAVGPYVEAKDAAILARIARVGDDDERTERFTLDRQTRVAIYALGEGSGDEMYDYGWIEEAASGRIVWEMTYRMTDAAGGAKKNRLFQGTLVLDPGKYAVHYRTDGSHSFNDWNAAPPADPEGWGIQVSKAGEG
jgi:hypothetical protein